MSGNAKRVAVLGASGSIGGSVLDVLDRYGEELGLEIVLLSARSRGRELYDRFRDRKVTVISDDNFGAHGTAAECDLGVATRRIAKLGCRTRLRGA